MDLQMNLIFSLLLCFHKNRDTNYFGALDDFDVIFMMVDMKLIEIFNNGYFDKGYYNNEMFIKVTPKGMLFIKSYSEEYNNYRL